MPSCKNNAHFRRGDADLILDEIFEVSDFHFLVDLELVDFVGEELDSDEERVGVVLGDDWLRIHAF